jgi:uncharacterized protein YaeQ
VVDVPEETSRALAAWVDRTMRIECTIQEGQVWLSRGGDTLHFEPRRLKIPA